MEEQGKSPMSARVTRASFALAACLALAGMMTVAAPAPAAAQGLFERLFGGLRRHVERPAGAPTAFADPFTSLARALNPPQPSAQRGETGGPSKGFCVRTCDGHYFPVQTSGGVSAAAMCNAFCPASDTQVFGGSNIDYAVARDGSRYTDLDNAFAYRKQLVAGCTCNGRDPFGLAHIDPAEDPTLRPGDIVATKSGLVVYSGSRNKTAEFTPVGSYGGFSKGYRDKLSELKLMPPTPESQDVTSSIKPAATGTARNDDRNSARITR